MKSRYSSSIPPATRFLAILFGVAGTVLALLIGAVALAVILGFGLIAAAVLAARVWWLRRRLGANRPPPDSPRRGNVIEGEYHRQDDFHQRPPD